jgi:hypothetical protein
MTNAWSPDPWRTTTSDARREEALRQAAFTANTDGMLTAEEQATCVLVIAEAFLAWLVGHDVPYCIREAYESASETADAAAQRFTEAAE